VKNQLAVCTALVLLGAGTAGTAGAQIVYPVAPASEAVLPPYEVMSIVRSTGLAPLARPMRRGPYYVLVAVDRVGRQMRVVVDARLGDIVNLRPALASGSFGPELARANALPGAAPAAEPAPPPIASVPNPRPPSAASQPLPPTHLAVTEPASPPPLPRPRPHLAASDVRAPAVSPLPPPPDQIE
jgi:hypothetical protein